ncbi:hypothetical protein [Anaerovibrio sp. RM50]|uniref:hypothetical protein n=1 Tax=Anaerovibrio sp. RM50 TaxID=1200557 RepID=UPI00056B3288|nr:hypothetical protein [Anaerovibrio sp. RM50]
MNILKNITKQELDLYASQPTAKAMHERVMKDSVYIPGGDADAAAVFVDSRNKEKEANQVDMVDISKAGQELSQTAAQKTATEATTETPNIVFSMFRHGDTNKFSISFGNSAMVERAVKQGYIEIDGRKVELSDDVKKQLLATNKQIKAAKEAVAMHNMMLHEAANARQSSDAMEEYNAKMSRVMTTATRIMRGRKVSPADEKELMEFNKDLYAMAKSAAAIEKHRRKMEEEREDNKISEANDEARAKEAEPKDYSVEETPMPQNEVQMDISLDGDSAQVTAVGAGLPME